MGQLPPCGRQISEAACGKTPQKKKKLKLDGAQSAKRAQIKQTNKQTKKSNTEPIVHIRGVLAAVRLRIGSRKRCGHGRSEPRVQIRAPAKRAEGLRRKNTEFRRVRFHLDQENKSAVAVLISPSVNCNQVVKQIIG
jgi:hypothetical protein